MSMTLIIIVIVVSLIIGSFLGWMIEEFSAFVLFSFVAFVILGLVTYSIAGSMADARSVCSPSGEITPLYPISESAQIANKFNARIYTSTDGLNLTYSSYDPDRDIITLIDGEEAYMERWVLVLAPEESIHGLLVASESSCEWHYYVPDPSYYRITN